MKMKTKNNRAIYILLFIILLLQLVRIIYVFAVEKDGFHSDEIWSYGLANSYYQPYLYKDEYSSNKNMEKWLDGQVLRDYITVQENERFSYDSVISNMKKDLHPPFYFLILHTICSFFPDKFSKWYGFSINIFCFVVTQMFLFLLSEKMLKSKWKALAVIVLYGFSAAGVSVYIFIRHYSMAVMFITIAMYYHACLIECKEENETKKNILFCSISSALGMLTLYIDAILLFFLACIFCLFFLHKKNIKTFFLYTVAMLISTVPMLCLSGFSSVFIGIGKSQISNNYSAIQTSKTGLENKDYYRIAINSILYDFFGIKYYSSLKNSIKDLIVILIPLWIFAVILLIVLQVKKKILFIVKEKIKELIVKKYNGIIRPQIIMWVSVIILIIINIRSILMSSEIFFMISFIDRYLFPIYTLIAMLFTALIVILSCIISKIIFIVVKLVKKSEVIVIFRKTSQAIFMIMFIGGLAISISKSESRYIFAKSDEVKKVEKLTRCKNIGLFLSQKWLITCFPNILFDAEKVYCAEIGDGNYSVLTKMIDSKDKPDYIWVDITEIGFKNGLYDLEWNFEDQNEIIRKTESEYISLLEEGYGDNNVQLIGRDLVFERSFLVYSVK